MQRHAESTERLAPGVAVLGRRVLRREARAQHEHVGDDGLLLPVRPGREEDDVARAAREPLDGELAVGEPRAREPEEAAECVGVAVGEVVGAAPLDLDLRVAADQRLEPEEPLHPGRRELPPLVVGEEERREGDAERELEELESEF